MLYLQCIRFTFFSSLDFLSRVLILYLPLASRHMTESTTWWPHRQKPCGSGWTLSWLGQKATLTSCCSELTQLQGRLQSLTRMKPYQHQVDRPNRPIPLTVDTQNCVHINRKSFVTEKEEVLIQSLIINNSKLDHKQQKNCLWERKHSFGKEHHL